MNQQHETRNSAFVEQIEHTSDQIINTERQKIVTQSSTDGPSQFKECNQIKSPEFNMHVESDKLN